MASNIAGLGPAANQSILRAMNRNNQELGDTLEKIASGHRIIHASDDAAGLAIANQLDAQIRSLSQAERNSQNAIGVTQVAEGGLNTIGDLLMRVRELSVQGSDDEIDNNERDLINTEKDQLIAEIDRTAKTSQYLGHSLLSGDKDLHFNVGIHQGADNVLVYPGSQADLTASGLGVSSVSLDSPDSAVDAVEKADQAFDKVNHLRAQLGGLQTRLLANMDNLDVYRGALAGVKSGIQDADLAQESTKLVSEQIQRVASIAVLSQANALSTQVLRLIEPLV